MSSTLLYFAYGSNLLTRRLRERTPSAQVVAVAALPQHGLRWHKAAQDGSGKCDVIPDPEATVWGVVYRLDSREKPALDAAETLGVGYAQKQVWVQANAGPLQAWVYYALKTHPAALPYDWYHALVVTGAREHGLPPDYVATLAAAPSKPDPDLARAALHAMLLRGAERQSAARPGWPR
jgi:gamma-glutamylcyclotransferase